MDPSQVNVSWTTKANPAQGILAPQPRKDAVDPGFVRSRKVKADPQFLRIAAGLLHTRTDAALTVAFARSMEHRIAKVYAIEFAKYMYDQYFPTSTEIDPGAMSWSYKMIERIGNAGVIHSGNARDLARVSLGGQETQMPVITYGASYGFNVIEENSAALANIAIENELAKATREAIVAFADKMYCSGVSGTGIVGVTNAPGVAVLPQQSTGTWQTQIKTIISGSATGPTVAAALAGDLAFMKQAIAINTLERQEATDCLLPTNLHQMLQYVPESSTFNSKSLLTFLEEVTGLRIRSWNQLQNAGNVNGSTLTLAGSGAQQKTRVIVYDNDPDVVELMEAQPFIQLAPQIAGLEYTVPCFERSGGVKVVRPLGIVCMDGL